MKKLLIIKILFVSGLIFLTLQGGCQSNDDHNFKVPIYVVKIIFPDGSSMETALSGGQTTWQTLAGKPLLFPPESHSHNYSAITDKPLTFTPTAHSHVLADITDLISEPLTPKDVQDAINLMSLISPPKKTTYEISTLTPTDGDIVFDKSLGVWKGFKNGEWATFIMNK